MNNDALMPDGRGGASRSRQTGHPRPHAPIDRYPSGKILRSSKINIGTLVSALVLLLLMAGCGPERARYAPQTAECKDGTHSTATGRGACSHHGGLK